MAAEPRALRRWPTREGRDPGGWLAALVVLLCACGGPPSEPGPRASTGAERQVSAGEETPPDLRNARLPNLCSDYEPAFIHMVDGRGSYGMANEEVVLEMDVVTTDRADLDGDLRDEWLALIYCHSGTRSSVWALRRDGDEWVAVAEIPGGDDEDGGPRLFRVEGAEVVVVRYTCDEERDSDVACPTHSVDERWRLDGDRFRRASVGAPEPLPTSE